MTVFRDLIPRTVVEIYWRETCVLPLLLWQVTMEVVSTPQLTVSFWQTTWHSIPEDSHIYTLCHKNLKSYLRSCDLVRGFLSCFHGSSSVYIYGFQERYASYAESYPMTSWNTRRCTGFKIKWKIKPNWTTNTTRLNSPRHSHTHTHSPLTQTHRVTHTLIQTRELNSANDFNGFNGLYRCHFGINSVRRPIKYIIFNIFLRKYEFLCSLCLSSGSE
jgi:hypothetical protein